MPSITHDEIEFATTIATIFSAIAAIGGIVVASIALMIARSQTKAALFEVRFSVYRKLSSSIAEMNIEGGMAERNLNEIREALHLARFLYSKGVAEQIGEIWKKGWSAMWLGPKGARPRTSEEFEKQHSLQEEINGLWDEIAPKIERSLRTWRH